MTVTGTPFAIRRATSSCSASTGVFRAFLGFLDRPTKSFEGFSNCSLLLRKEWVDPRRHIAFAVGLLDKLVTHPDAFLNLDFAAMALHADLHSGLLQATLHVNNLTLWPCLRLHYPLPKATCVQVPSSVLSMLRSQRACSACSLGILSRQYLDDSPDFAGSLTPSASWCLSLWQ